jgi:hypothetical protein
MNIVTLRQLASTVRACAAAIRDGNLVRGMDLLISLETLAALLEDAAAREC